MSLLPNWLAMRARSIDTSDDRTFGQKAADGLTGEMGSWRFIIIFLVVLAVWTGFNVVAVKLRFDPYPFIFLNLMLSCLAAIQAPIIMMSQKRQDEISKKRQTEDLDHGRQDLKIDQETNLMMRRHDPTLEKLKVFLDNHDQVKSRGKTKNEQTASKV